MRVLIRSPLDTLHTPIVLSLDPDAKYSPFGENTTLKTLIRVSSEGFDSFSARYPPHSDSIVHRSRRQILSVRRKYYAKDSTRVSSEGFDSFSARYLPHSDSIVSRSRRQILFVRRKYYALTQ